MIVIKTGLTKDGKPFQVARVDSPLDPGRQGAKVRFFGTEIGFRELEMYQLAQFALDTMKARVQSGVGSDDSPMPPLKEQTRQRWSAKQQRFVEYGSPSGYPQVKKRAGLPAVRNLTLTGKMLNDLSVRSVSASEARMDITTTESRMKARTNEIRSPWFGWSPQDATKIYQRARELFGESVRSAGLGVTARSGTIQAGKLTERSVTAAPVWMNLFQRVYPGSRDAEWANALRAKIKTGTVARRRRTA